MTKIGLAILAFCAVGVSMAQPATNDSQPLKPRHVRLTFALTYPDGQQAAQNYSLDVPVTANHSGMSSMTIAAGTAGQDEGSVKENLQCTNVRESTKGVAAKVTFSIDRVSMTHLAGINEPLHNQVTFEHEVDLVLGQTTQITEAMQRKPLGNDDANLPVPPSPPQITVTATLI